jgi:hypothetical protein
LTALREARDVFDHFDAELSLQFMVIAWLEVPVFEPAHRHIAILSCLLLQNATSFTGIEPLGIDRTFSCGVFRDLSLTHVQDLLFTHISNNISATR